MNVDPTIFKAYDIRGTFPKQINAHVAELIGRALADFLPTAGAVAVGRDMRRDSDELAQALMEGLAKQGRDVIDIGLVSSDMAAFSSKDLAGAAMITASHNPGQYNGIKLYGHQAQPIAIDSGEAEIRDAVMDGNFKAAAQPGDIDQHEIDADWIRHAESFVDSGKWPAYRVGVDAANGMMGRIWPEVAKRLPIELTPLFFELDGRFPNHQPNPAITANLAALIKTVKSKSLDLGIAFDGDGDRAFFVDETGTPLSGSETGAILAQRFLQQNPGSTVLYDVRMSRIVPEVIAEAGGQAIRTPVGGGYIRPLMHKHQAILGCEGAGHYYFRDNYYSDSGLITALLILDIMASSSKRLSELAAPLRKYANSGEISVPVLDPQAVIKRLAEVYKSGVHDQIDGLSVDLGDWWFNLRASNTEPLIRLNLEATTKAIMDQRRDEVLKLIRS